MWPLISPPISADNTMGYEHKVQATYSYRYALTRLALFSILIKRKQKRGKGAKST